MPATRTLLMQLKIGITHPVITLAAVLPFGWKGGAGATLYFIGREIAQAEYRWIEKYGEGLRKNMPWWGRFDPRVWDLHSVTDFVIPALITAAAYFIRS